MGDPQSLNRFALVDCNNFFVSCERVFNPSLHKKPVVVLSGNDGCVIARSNEAKSLGVGMGMPWFKSRDEAALSQVIALSSNFSLYADMSERVMRLLRKMCPMAEVYSIDECFLNISEIQESKRLSFSRQIVAAIDRMLGLPVCLGIGSTKTRAKLANSVAKKSEKNARVFDLEALSSSLLLSFFSQLPVEDVWGIGHRLKAQLHKQRIFTAKDLYLLDPVVAHKSFALPLQRTYEELKGHIALAREPDAMRKSITYSRAFGALQKDLGPIEEALVHYIANAAVKLRLEGLMATMIDLFLVFPMTKDGLPHSSVSLRVPLNEATSSTRDLIAAAQHALKKIYREGIFYQKVGVTLHGLVPGDTKQYSLLGNPQHFAKDEKLMNVVDAINQHYGKGALKWLKEGIAQEWKSTSRHCSPAYTTDWEQLPRIKI